MIGSVTHIDQKKYEVVSIFKDGCLKLRPANNQRKEPAGSLWSIGERVRIVGIDLDEELAGEIVSTAPLAAKVVGSKMWDGMKVSSKNIRKSKVMA